MPSKAKNKISKRRYPISREEEIKEEFFSSPVTMEFQDWLIKKLIKTEERTLPSSYHRKKEEKLQDEIKELKGKLLEQCEGYESWPGAIGGKCMYCEGYEADH